MIDGRALIVAGLLALAGCSGGGPSANNGAAANNGTAATPAPTPEPTNAASDNAAAPAAPAAPEPVFTSLKPADCRLVEENAEEGAYARFLCPGREGRQLEVVDADGRSNLIIRGPGAREGNLNLTSVIANGAFSSLGDTAEWIGADRLIVRYGYVTQPDTGRETSYLLVIDSGAARPCVVAKIDPGPDQNTRARAAAADPARRTCIAGA